MTTRFSSPDSVMRHAIELATKGQGFVEPNPMVGAVLVDADLALLGEGFHEQFGGPHAEVNALAGETVTSDSRLFVTLEPCCHHGKTPPCTQAILDNGIKQVAIATVDPAAHAAGKGIEQLRQSGVQVEVGLLQSEAQHLIAPFTKLMTSGSPYVHAKWAMSLDGKIATRTGNSQWISNEESRAIVHELRGRMDAIIVGAETARQDDPLLTARPQGPRKATRVVIDNNASLSLESQLIKTIDQAPVIVVCSDKASHQNIEALKSAGAEVVQIPGSDQVDITALLSEFGNRKMTNVLVEGGGKLLGSINDAHLIDEAHIFIGPRILGGADSVSPVEGDGNSTVAQSAKLGNVVTKNVGTDTYINGRVQSGQQSESQP